MPAMTMLMSLLSAVMVTAVITLCENRLRPAATDWWRNVQSWVLGLAVGFTLLPVFSLSGLPSLVDGGALPFWIAFPLFLLVRDFGEYLFHRAQHAVPFLWAMHALHHSDADMWALTTQRHFWGDQLIKNLTIWPLTAMVVAPTPGMIAGFAAFSLWNYFVHARLPVHLGRWSWLINSPAYH